MNEQPSYRMDADTLREVARRLRRQAGDYPSSAETWLDAAGYVEDVMLYEASQSAPTGSAVPNE